MGTVTLLQLMLDRVDLLSCAGDFGDARGDDTTGHKGAVIHVFARREAVDTLNVTIVADIVYQVGDHRKPEYYLVVLL